MWSYPYLRYLGLSTKWIIVLFSAVAIDSVLCIAVLIRLYGLDLTELFENEFHAYSLKSSIGDVAVVNAAKAAMLCAFTSFNLFKVPVVLVISTSIGLLTLKAIFYRHWGANDGMQAVLIIVSIICAGAELLAVLETRWINDNGDQDPDVELMKPPDNVIRFPKGADLNRSKASYIDGDYPMSDGDSDDNPTSSINRAGVDLEEPLLTPGDQIEVDAKKGSDSVNNMGTLLSLLHYARPDALLLYLGFCFLLVSALARLSLPGFASQCLAAIVTLGAAGTGGGVASLLHDEAFRDNLAALGIAASLYAFFSALRIWCTAKAEVRLMARVQRVLFAAILRQDIQYFDKYGTGQLTSRITSDATQLGSIVTTNCNWVLQTSISLFGSIIYLFFLSWRLALVYVLICSVFFALTKSFGAYVRKLQKTIQDVKSDANQVCEEAISCIRLVRAFSSEGWEKSLYDRWNKAMALEQLRSKMAYTLYVPLVAIVQNGLTLSVLFYGGTLVSRGEMSGASITAFLFYSQTVQDNMNTLSEQIITLAQGLGAGEKIFEIINHTPKMKTYKGATIPDSQVRGEIRVKNVLFSYPSTPNVLSLDSVSLSIRPGEKVAVVGPSGSGKSTLIGLLLRYYDPRAGSVEFDNMNIQSLDVKWLRGKIGVVTQDSYLFGVSIRDNIAYGQPNMTNEEVENAAKLSNAHDFIMEMPQGYATVLGERGVTLSGGQRQRIAICRAVARQPRLLLLDEATSSLDSHSESIVVDALNNLHKRIKPSMLIVAHRLSTVQDADRIVVMQRGRIVEVGTHKELLGMKGVYHVLVSRQLQSEILGSP